MLLAGVKRFVYISAADFGGAVNYLLRGYYEGQVLPQPYVSRIWDCLYYPSFRDLLLFPNGVNISCFPEMIAFSLCYYSYLV